MADNKVAYVASAAVTISLGSLASSSTLVAGRSSLLIDNTSDLYLDRQYSTKIRTSSTSTTANTSIEIWAIPVLNDTGPVYFDTFDGTDKNVTVSSRAKLASYGILLSTIHVDTTAASQDYAGYASLASRVGSLLPRKYQLFVVHNTGNSFDATGGNHVITEMSGYVTTI